jgi:uncharacterized protein (DUF58 family)
MWDAAVLSRVRHLHLVARTVVDRLLAGAHRSRRLGAAVEFADFVPYGPGHDLRHLDWKMLARTDRAVVKRFQVETEIPVTVILDLSGDVGAGAGPKRGLPDIDGTKAGYTITLAATLLYLFSRLGEPVGLEIVAGEGVSTRSLPPRGGRAHLQRAFAVLGAARPGGAADLEHAIARVGERVKRRSLAIVVTDGMEEPARWLPSLGGLLRRKTDLRLLHVYDRAEWKLDLGGPLQVYSPEGGDDVPLDPGAVARSFGEVVDAYVAEVRAGVVAPGGLYRLCPTDEPLDRAVGDVLRGVPGGDAWR